MHLDTIAPPFPSLPEHLDVGPSFLSNIPQPCEITPDSIGRASCTRARLQIGVREAHRVKLMDTTGPLFDRWPKGQRSLAMDGVGNR